jgi:uncharacterized LabA/DUF88 family protein
MATRNLHVYIDAENLDSSAIACGYTGIDYPKLYNWLRTTRGASKVYLYAGYSDAVEKTAYEALKKVGYIVHLKKVMQYPDQKRKHKLKCPSCGITNTHKINYHGRRKANCDSELTLDVINDGVRKKYKGIIVFSGDGDFGNMYFHLVNIMKIRVTVYSPMSGVAGRRTSTHIKNMGTNGMITLNALEGILPQYGIK